MKITSKILIRVSFLGVGLFLSTSVGYSDCAQPQITGSCIPKKYECTGTSPKCCFQGSQRLWIGEDGRMASQIQASAAAGIAVTEKVTTFTRFIAQPMPFCSS